MTFPSLHPAPSRWRVWLLAVGLLLALPAPRPLWAEDPAQTKGEAAGPADRPVPEALNFANALLRDKNYARAADEYARFLKEVPTGPDAAEALYGLARARLFQGKKREARAHYEAFLKMVPLDHPGAPTALFRVGETSYMLGDLPAARKALEAFTASQPSHRDLESAWPYLGDVCFLLGDLPQARHAYEQALAQAPKGRLVDRARYGLGQTLAAQGEPEAALKLFQALVDREAVGWADKAQYQIGQVQMRTGRLDEAIEAFAVLERVYPQSALVREARLRRAEALIQAGRREEGETLLRPLAAERSQAVAVQAAYDLGVSLLARGRAKEARAALEAALKRFPGAHLAPALMFRAAEAAQKEGRADVARANFEKVAEVAPDDPWADDALLRAAALALEARDYAGAQALAAALASRFSSSTLRPDAHLIEARAALALGAPKRAIALLSALLADEKPSPETAQAARYYLGQAYRADGQSEKAAEVLEALARTPAAPVATDAQFLLGQEHFRAGRFAEAIGPLEKYLAGKPQGEVAEYALAYLAAAQQAQGQMDLALETLANLARQFPKAKLLDTTRIRLAEACQAAKQFERAAALYRDVADGGDPKWKVTALSGLGWSLLQGGKPNEAASAFASRLEADRSDPLAGQDALAMARALEEAGHAQEAADALGRIAQQFPHSETASSALLARARLMIKLKRPEDAAHDFAAYLEKPPKNATDIDQVLAEQGSALLDARKTAEADAAFGRLVREFPSSPRAAEARLNLAESAYEAKRYDEVAQLLDPLVGENAPADPMLVQSALYRLGRTAIARGDWAGAAARFDALLTRYPSGPFCLEARFWKAEAAFQANDAKSAEAQFAELATEPPSPETEKWIQTARLRRVQSLLLLEQWKDALAQADSLKADAPNHPQMAEIQYARGRSLQGLAQFEEARAAYQSAIDARKGGDLAARAQLMRGETFFHEKHYSEALREFLKVDLLYEAPQWQAAALLEAGKVYERLAQWTDAAEIYKKLCGKFPNDPSAKEASRRLDEVQKQAAAPAGAPATSP